MQVAQYVVEQLIKYGVTDAFGIPGGVVLRLLYAMNDRESQLTPHLTYHEQTAGFAACGYSQASGRLGVAYATRGPGFTNMITCIAEAYQESLPVLFITAHGQRPERGMRFENNQELDAVGMISHITKFAANVETVEEVSRLLEEACECALGDRKGPVLLDFNSNLWMREIIPISEEKFKQKENIWTEGIKFRKEITEKINAADRPVILIGDGIRHVFEREKLYHLIEKLNIPILSSRGAQDILSGSPLYYGYIGSHGIRYSNFILAKADLIITIGNRMAFPVTSESYAPIINQAEIIRVDIDKKEFIREIPDASNYVVDAKYVFEELDSMSGKLRVDPKWIAICDELRNSLDRCDVTQPVIQLENYLREETEKVFVCDIGNNEFWFARAFEKSREKGMVFYSKAYGTLGAGLGRTIGIYYALRKPVCCIIGDQGFQYNIQELAYIKKWQLPIKIIVLNNRISGMITDHEKKIFGERLVHVNEQCGYEAPTFSKIVQGYGLSFTRELNDLKKLAPPMVYEIEVDPKVGLSPNLPKGRACQDMEPRLEEKLYKRLDQL